MKTVVIGAGSDLGVQINGAVSGPIQLIRDMSSFYKGEIISITQSPAIIKNRNLAEKRKNELEINSFNKALYNKVGEKLDNGLFPVTIGGDASISIATILASLKHDANTGVIWLGAHPEYNNYETTPTGNVHGMTLATITGNKCDELRSFHETGTVVNPMAVSIIGARSIDGREQEAIKYNNVNIFSTEDIKSMGAGSIVDEAFRKASEKATKFHVVFDLDLIDPTVSIGVSEPADNGIDEKTTMELIDAILTHIDDICAFDIVEFNPTKDPERKTEQIALNILAKMTSTIDEYEPKENEATS